MKRFPKLIVTLLVLAMAIGIFAAIPVSAASDYEALKLKPKHLTVGHYTSLDMNGEIVKHSANTDYMHEIGCMIDNDNRGAYWSKPYKFKDLKDGGGTIVPVILIDVAATNDGNPVAVSAFDMRLRSAMDCRPTHVVLQAIVEEGSNNWVTVADQKFTNTDWDASPTLRIKFSEVTAYQFRFLAYDIGDVDIAADDYKDYVVCKGDETRLALAEIDLLKAKEGGSTGDSGTTKPTQPSATRPQTPTRPGQTPTRPSATTAPTQPTTPSATTAPAQPTTPSATTAPNKPTTPSATTAPNKPTTPNATTVATQPTTPGATTVTTEPTGTVDPSVPTEPVGTVDPSAPTVDPSAPTEEATVAPTEEPTVAPTVEATEPEATTPTTDTPAEEDPKDFTGIVIAGIAAAVVIAGLAIFFIIKKKKQG